jgi:carbamoyltransferase
MSKVLNKNLQRNDFMPFAPMVLKEDFISFIRSGASDLDILAIKSAYKFMTATVDVQEKIAKIFSEIVHVDGTARPQVVEQFSNPLIYSILVEVKRLIGWGIVINTSFNLHETLIVESPQIAVNILKQKKIDYLYIFGNLYNFTA